MVVLKESAQVPQKVSFSAGNPRFFENHKNDPEAEFERVPETKRRDSSVKDRFPKEDICLPQVNTRVLRRANPCHVKLEMAASWTVKTAMRPARSPAQSTWVVVMIF